MDRRPVFDASLNLANHLPFGKAQEFLEGRESKPNVALRIPEDIGKLTEDNHCGDHSL
jgi:hypothetical protein